MKLWLLRAVRVSIWHATTQLFCSRSSYALIVWKYIIAGLINPLAILDENPWVVKFIIPFLTLISSQRTCDTDTFGGTCYFSLSLRATELISFRPWFQCLRRAFSSIGSTFVRVVLHILLVDTHYHSVSGKNLVAPILWVGSLYSYWILVSLKRCCAGHPNDLPDWWDLIISWRDPSLIGLFMDISGCYPWVAVDQIRGSRSWTLHS